MRTERSTMWVFHRGLTAVCLSRLRLPGGGWALLVEGPGPTHRTEECADLVACVWRQQAVEADLVGDGYCLEQMLQRPRAASR